MKSKALVTHLLALPLIFPIGIVIAYTLRGMTGCTGWDGGGTCSVSFLAPIYTFVIGIMTWASFMFVFWLPVAILFCVICIVRLIGVYKRGEEKPFSRYWLVLTACSIWTYFFLYIFFIVF